MNCTFGQWVMILLLAAAATSGIPTAAESGRPALLLGSVEAVLHEGLVTFRVDHADAVAISIKVYVLETDAVVYDSGPRRGTLVSWPVGDRVTGDFRYVVTAWNADGEVVVSQAAVTKSFTPISEITFDSIPGDTKFLGPGEIIMAADVQVGEPEGVRIDADNSGRGGGIYFRDEAGANTALIIPDGDGEGGYLVVYGPDGSAVRAQGMGVGGEPDFQVWGTSEFGVFSGATGDASVVLPTGAVSAVEMMNEPGVAEAAETIGLQLPLSYGDVLEKSMTPPTAGFIMASAVVGLDLSHSVGGQNYIDCSISETSNTPFYDGRQIHNVPASAPSGIYSTSIAMIRIVPVTAGPHSLYVVCRRDSNGISYAVNRQLALLFVPTSYD